MRKASSSPAWSTLLRPGTCSTTSSSRADPGDLGDRHPCASPCCSDGGSRADGDRPPRVGEASAVERARQSSTWESVDHVAAVATHERFDVPAAGRSQGTGRARRLRGQALRCSVALTGRGLMSSASPPTATAADVAACEPDLVVLSPGPGDPSRMAPEIETVRELAASAAAGGRPILAPPGHLLGLAAGARTRRLAAGHHGGNHAVLEAETGRADIGAHNHEVEVVDGPAPPRRATGSATAT